MSTEIKNLFPIFKTYPELVYLDSAASSQKPQVVIARIVKYYSEENANVHRGIYKLSELATKVYEESRETVAKFLGVRAKEVVFTSGATAAANLLAASFVQPRLEVGDVIISSVAEHHSNFLPLQRAAEFTGTKLELVELTEDFGFDYNHYEKLLAAHGAKTKVIALSAISNVLGYKLDLQKISQLREQYTPGAVIIMDVAQWVGHHPLNLAESGVDFAFFSGHKFLAETGIGVLWGKAELLESMPPQALGGGMVQRVEREKSSFAEIPGRFEAGTPHVSGAVSLAAACDFIDEVGWEKIEGQNEKLKRYTLEKLAEMPECKLLGPLEIDSRSNVFAITLGELHPHDVAEFLDSKNIAVRAGHHCTHILHRDVLNVAGTVRISTHVYNSTEDIDKLIVALKECLIYFAK